MIKRLFTRLLAALRPAPRKPDPLLAMLASSGTLEPRPFAAADDFPDTEPLPELSDFAQFERATRP